MTGWQLRIQQDVEFDQPTYKSLVLELARCEYIERNHNVIALGNSGTSKTHIALGLLVLLS